MIRAAFPCPAIPSFPVPVCKKSWTRNHSFPSRIYLWASAPFYVFYRHELRRNKGFLKKFFWTRMYRFPSSFILPYSHFTAVSARTAASRKVDFGIPQISAAVRKVICLLRHAFRNSSKLSGRIRHGTPNLTPLAFAAAMPSACRWRMFSRSVWAT